MDEMASLRKALYEKDAAAQEFEIQAQKLKDQIWNLQATYGLKTTDTRNGKSKKHEWHEETTR
jgi:hypothetical protein